MDFIQLAEPTVIRMFTKCRESLTRKDTRELKKKKKKSEENKGTYYTAPFAHHQMHLEIAQV